jgi:hypothetical protein
MEEDKTKAKTEKIILDGYGSFLGRDKGCLLVRDEKGKETRYPLVENEIGEVQKTKSRKRFYGNE